MFTPALVAVALAAGCGLILHNPNTEDASYWVFIWDAQWYRSPE